MSDFPIITPRGMSDLERARVEDALGRIAIGDAKGTWPSPEWVEVQQMLSGGFSGALVLRIAVRFGTQTQTQIAKIGADAVTEWKAYREIFADYHSVLCPPIAAVTKGVLDPRYAVMGEDEAVVYADVEHFAKAPATSLEDLVVAAGSGDKDKVETAVQVIDRLFRRAPAVLYSRYTVKDRWDRKLAVNHTLGPDLKLRAEHLVPGDSPQAHFRTHGGFRHLGTHEVLRSGLALDNAGEGDGTSSLPAGTPVVLSDFRLWPQGSVVGPSSFRQPLVYDRCLAGRDYVSVDVDCELSASEIDKLRMQPSINIYGTIEYTRSARNWERIKKIFSSVTLTDGGIAADGLAMAHPFGALDKLLTEPTRNFVIGVVHGDLNPRNVLVAETEPYLIDYAAARTDGPILSDLTWLELNLLRGPFAGVLDFAELIRLQRLLALGDRMSAMNLSPERESVDQALAEAAAGERPAFTGALRIVRTIRHHAAVIYPSPPGAGPWWHEYAAQLLLSAHRMFKWRDEMQSPGAWHAEVAVAAVATEQLLDEENPWRFWPEEGRKAAGSALLKLHPANLEGLLLYCQLMATDAHLERASGDLEQARRDLVAGALREVGQNKRDYAEWLGEVSDSSRSYVGLQARITKQRSGRSAPADGGGHVREAWTASALSLALGDRPTVLFGEMDLAEAHLLDELEYLCLRSANQRAERATGRRPPLLPVRTDAKDLIDRAGAGADGLAWLMAGRDLAPARLLLRAGAVQLLVGRFDEVSGDDRAVIAAWFCSVLREYPGTRITVCHQGKDAPAELDGWRTVVLSGPSPDQIGAFLGSRLAIADAKDLTSAIFDPQADPDFADLAGDPLLLSMLATTWNGGSRPRTRGDVIDAYVRSGLAAGEAEPGWIAYAESLAADLVGSGQAAASHRADVPSGLAGFVTTGREGTTSVRFRAQLYEDYFASRVLRELAVTDRQELVARVLSYAWRAAFLILVSFSDTDPSVIGELVRTVADADPCYAAELLRSAASPPEELAGWFAALQASSLADARAGSFVRERALRALVALGPAYPGGAEEIYGSLFAVVSDQAADAGWREFNLEALAEICRKARPGPRRSALAARLARQAGDLLTADEAPVGLRALTIRVAGNLELRGVTSLIAECVDASGPWPVVNAARQAMRDLGESLPVRLERAYQEAATARLRAIEEELPRHNFAVQTDRLQHERLRVLSELEGPSRLSEMLRGRFAFGIGEEISDLIDAKLPPDESIDLLAEITSTDQVAAAAAAHRLLRDRPDLAPLAFRRLASLAEQDQASVSKSRVLIAAAMIRQREVDFAEAVTHFRALLANSSVPASPGLEGLAVTLTAIASRDKRSAMREAWAAQDFLVRSAASARFRWPWPLVLSRTGYPVGELEMLLAAGDDSELGAAVRVLAAMNGFLLTAGRPPPLRLGPESREQLLRNCAELAASDLVLALQAAAVATLPEALSLIFPAGNAPMIGELIRGLEAARGTRLSLPGYDVIEVAPAAEALAALGYLARSLPRSDAMTADVLQALREFSGPKAHPSVETGRLTGLIYLGDFKPALEAVVTGQADARLLHIARNAILWTDPALVAFWIAGRLAGPVLSADAFSELSEIKQAAEERAGRLIVAARQENIAG